jgi:putative ABC transport system permease protein
MAISWQDVRYGLRMLARSPGFTFTALLSLALGIGATTAVFSVIHAVLISPYPYAGAERMFRLLAEDRSGITRNFFLTGPQFQQLTHLQSVDSALGQMNWELSTTGNDLPEDVRVVYLTSNASSYFGIPAMMGRELLPSDAVDAQSAVVLSFSFWQRYFGGHPDVLGKNLSMGHQNYTIVGVLPPRFAWTLADVYLPLKITNDPSRLIWVSSVKLKTGTPIGAAESEFQALLNQFANETPRHFPQAFRIHLKRLTSEHDGGFARTLYVLLAAVTGLLLIGCANVSILLVARGASRQHELAIRATVGASRIRILRQLLTESALLSLSGAVLGILLAYWVVAWITNWLPRFSYPHEASIRVDTPVLCFCVGLALATGIAFGLWPALRLSRNRSCYSVTAARRLERPAGAKRTHAFLAAAQIALTLLLLTAAGAATERFLRLIHARLGYDPSSTLVVGIPLHNNTYMTWQERAAFFSELRQRVAGIPGVSSAAISTRATPPANGLEEKFEIIGRSNLGEQPARLSLVSHEYFSLLHIPLVSGRTWDQAETTRGARLAVINETMARQYWPSGDPLGQAIRMPGLKSGPFGVASPDSDSWFQIVGVVADARNDGLAENVKPAVYVPYTTLLELYTHILVRSQVSPASLLRAVREQVRSVDPDQQVEGQGQVVRLEDLIAKQGEWQQGHLAAILLGAFGLIALALATVGLYSVVSYGVAYRTNEFGIRMALGAQPRDVFKLVLASAAASVGSGIAVGALLSFWFRGTCGSSWVQRWSLPLRRRWPASCPARSFHRSNGRVALRVASWSGAPRSCRSDRGFLWAVAAAARRSAASIPASHWSRTGAPP